MVSLLVQLIVKEKETVLLPNCANQSACSEKTYQITYEIRLNVFTILVVTIVTMAGQIF